MPRLGNDNDNFKRRFILTTISNVLSLLRILQEKRTFLILNLKMFKKVKPH